MHSGPIALRDSRSAMAHGDLPRLVARERDWLRARGGERFGLLADNGCGWVIADRALAAAERLHVPLPGFFSVRQHQHVLADGALDRILTDDPERVQLLDPRFRMQGTAPASGLWLLARPSPSLPAPVPPGTRKVTYTSGSTGTPKGVCLTARALDAVTASLATVTRDLGLRRHLSLLPLATLLENLAGVDVTLATGGECVVPSLGTTGMGPGAPDVRRLTAAIGTFQPDSLILVPELLRLLVGAVAAGWQPPPALRFLAVGGAPVSPALLAQAAAAGLPVYEGYGLSECASVVALNTPGAHRPGSVGRPLAHARVRVDDAGEIHVGGTGFAGYLGDVRPGPAELATGDLGELDADGYLYVRGRRRNVLITSLGRNVSPEWVEGELLAEPAIGQALVAGEGRPWLCALLGPARPGTDPAALAAAVRRANARLPDYAQVGRWLVLDEPLSAAAGTLTANGRPRRSAILARHGRRLDALYADDRETC